jgi:hypothetical protein
VSVGEFYKDFDTGDAREIDVTVGSFHSLYRQGHNLMLRVYCRIECKSSKDKPWLLLVSEIQPSTIGVLSLLSTKLYREFLANMLITDGGFRETFQSAQMLEPPRLAYGLTQSLREKGVDVAYQALMGAVKAATDKIRDVESINTGKTMRAKQCCVAFPVIVIDGTLFECVLDDHNAVSLDEVDSGVVFWQGTNPLEIAPLVHVVTKSGLNRFIDRFSRAAATLAELTDKHIDLLESAMNPPEPDRPD